MRKKILLPITLLLVVVVAYLLFYPTPIDPVAWNPTQAPELVGDYEANDRLSAMEVLFPGQCDKCEDIAVDSIGRVYGGEINGNIVVFEDGERRVLTNTGGRPLGLHFDQDGHLIVADASQGLLSVDMDGDITVLVNEYDGQELIFVDDLEIDTNGIIYFSDASNKYGFHDNKLDILEGRGNGSLYAYDPVNKTTRLLLDDLYFANGIAVAHDQSFVLVNETGRYRIKRYWLTGPKAGQSDLFIENLPGFPDGVSQGSDGIFWVALITPRLASVDKIAPSPLLKNVVARLPEFMQPAAVRYGFVLGLDRNGQVRHNLQDPSGKFAEITSVQEFGGYLHLGSLADNGVGRWKLE